MCYANDANGRKDERRDDGDWGGGNETKVMDYDTDDVR